MPRPACTLAGEDESHGGAEALDFFLLIVLLFGVSAAFCVSEDVSPQAVLTENIEDLQEDFAVEGLAGKPFRNPSCVEVGVFLAA